MFKMTTLSSVIYFYLAESSSVTSVECEFWQVQYLLSPLFSTVNYKNPLLSDACS